VRAVSNRAPLLVVLAALACGEPPPPPSAAPPVVRPGLLASREIASASSFELVPHDEGALLVWGAPPARGAAVLAAPLSPLGEPRALDVLLSHALPIEIAVAADGARAAVAWVAQRDSRSTEIEVSAAFSAGGVAFGPETSLGPAEPLVTPLRGRLALSTGEDGAFFLSHRVPPGPCTGRDAVCARLARDRIDSPGSAQGDDPMEVPVPCDPFLVGSLRNAGTWFFALCHREDDGAPRATLYAIRPAISLAAASQVLIGCTPRGVAPTETGAAVIADCPEGRGIAWQDELGRPAGEIRNAQLEVSCTARPALRATGEGRTLEVPLTAAVGRIEGLLPDAIASPLARAVWTGAAILVAEPRITGEHREILLERHQCEDDHLVRTTP
jgi:hypothetical protein